MTTKKFSESIAWRLRRWRWGSSPNGRISGRHGWMIEAAKTRSCSTDPHPGQHHHGANPDQRIDRTISLREGGVEAPTPSRQTGRLAWPRKILPARHTLSGGRGNEFVLAISGMPAPFGAPHCATATSGAEGRDMAAFASQSAKIGRRLSPLRAGGEARDGPRQWLDLPFVKICLINPNGSPPAEGQS